MSQKPSFRLAQDNRISKIFLPMSHASCRMMFVVGSPLRKLAQRHEIVVAVV